jgi:[ribosomal protein S18]-alanine N-acetyltransferase
MSRCQYHDEMKRSHPTRASSSPIWPASGETLAAIAVDAARLRDLPALARLQRRAFPPRLAYTLPTLVLLWALPWVCLLVARRNGAIAGCVIGDRVIEGARVVNLAVDPDARRHGVGTALLQAIERALPAGDMTLMVQEENVAARALYRRAGYIEESESPNYYGPGRAGIRMRKARVGGG